MGRARLGWFAALTLVLLRLAIGWHFLSEGGEKLAYDPETGRYSVTFSAEGFLAGAQGPLAGLMEGLAPGEHRWRQLLAVPQQDKPLAEDEQTESHPPYHAWHQQIVADWHEAANRAKGDLAEGQLADADAALAAHEQQLAEYLAEIEADVTDYQHELWRLEQWEHDPKAGELPYFDERIATKRAEVNRLPRPWIGQVTTFGQDLQNELAAMSDNHASANPTQPAPR